MCQINISGLSPQSQTALNRYSSLMKNDVLAIQETLIDPNNINKELPIFSNMESFYLQNDRGVSLSIKTMLHPQRITDLEDESSDAIWATLTYNAATIVMVGSIYTNPNLTSANCLTATLKNIANAKKFCDLHKIKNMVVLGDLNSRNIKWGDSITNNRGTHLDDFVTNNDLVCVVPNSQTFLCQNGGSVIDIAILSGAVTNFYNSSSADKEVELFSGAPLRGHVPVTHQFGMLQSKPQDTTEILYKDMKNTDWKSWRQKLSYEVSSSTDENLEGYTCPFSLWDSFKNTLTQVNDTEIPTKRVTEHSKPFWTPELSALSKNVQKARRRMNVKSTPVNIFHYKQVKQLFADGLISEKNSWIRSELEHLNVIDSKVFWKNYKRTIIGKKKEFLGNLEEGGILYTENATKEELLFKTFFDDAHMENGEFDAQFKTDISEKYTNIFSPSFDPTYHPGISEEHSSAEHDHLNYSVTVTEVVDAILHQKASVKSFDDNGIHPSMIKRFPDNAVAVLTKIFNLCLDLGVWVWDTADVVFLKKDGKPNYMKAGAYRPISLSSYIGKLYERVLERRLRFHCDLEGVLDDEQEGFQACRNTTRYLYKLTANLKASQKKKFTSFLLCLDFQKAFDSVWLKGLIVKLYTLNIKGNILKVINSFLFSRKVRLIINKCHGSTRKCGNYGVPQGSVLSPLLFIIFIADMFKESKGSQACRELASVYKYADDGSIAISHKDPTQCHRIAQLMCDHLSNWCKRWRLKVNCDKNKTECLIIQSYRGQKPACILPKLKIGDKEISYVQNTTVLGIVIDDKLTFEKHSKQKLQQCWFSWYNIMKNCTRFRGLNVSSLVILFKTVVLTKLLYAAPVWLKDNIRVFKKFYARVCLKISGSTHYASQNLTLLAIGLEPLSVQSDIITTKFLLKALHSDVNMRSMILQIEGARDHPFHSHIILAKKYLQSRIETDDPVLNRSNSDSFDLSKVSAALSFYQKSDMVTYKLKVWKEHLLSDTGTDSKLFYLLTLSDMSQVEFNLTNCKLLFPRNSKRSTDTQVMDLIHGHSLNFGSFKYTLGKRSHPNCNVCRTEDHNFHQLMECPKFNCSSYRQPLATLCESPDCEIGIFLSVILEADKEQVICFRNMAQIIVKISTNYVRNS